MNTRLHTLLFLTLLAGAFVFGLLGCRGQTSKEPQIVPIRNMYDQPRFDPQEKTNFFEDGRTMRMPVEGSVAQEMDVDLENVTGRTQDGSSWVETVPSSITSNFGSKLKTIERGQERYGIYCAACHGISGHGNGMVATRAEKLMASALKPPTFHDDRIRQMPDGQLYATITNGIRNMPAYRHSIPNQDRWAIVAYVRALQLNQKDVSTSKVSPSKLDSVKTAKAEGN